MADRRDRTTTWFVVAGALVGLALGILVSVTTDVPFAPEAGLLLGALVGWFSRGRRHGPLPD
jgi:F0F1-type ATP synthase assembly protein I